MTEAKKTYNIAVVGPADLVSGFRALGVDVFDAEDGQTALTHLKTIKQQTDSEDTGETKYGAVFVIDRLVNDIPGDDYRKVTEGTLPSVIAIPGLYADKEAGVRKLKQLTEKAIGSDILSNN